MKAARQPDDLLDALSVTATLERIVRLVIKRNVEHRAEIEVETEKPEEPAGDFAMTPHEGDIVSVPELLGIRRLVADQPQPRNPTAFLVDRDDRFHLAEVAQIVDQLPELRRALNVAAKENVSARLDAAK